MSKPILYFLVTNSLYQDQRLQKICDELANNDYQVNLVGVRKKQQAFTHENFKCHSLQTVFKSGPLFYLEINLRFFFFLLFRKLDAVVANDLDTLLAAKTISLLRSKKLFVDLHEYFTEVPELQDKPIKKKIWDLVRRIGLSKRSTNYTVNESLATIFKEKFKLPFEVIHNFPEIYPEPKKVSTSNKLSMVYVGMVNAGRGVEEVLTAIKELDAITFTIYGDGDKLQHCKSLCNELGLGDKVTFKGFTNYDKILQDLPNYNLGINLLHSDSLNYYYSSANKFFDYTMAGVPSLSMNFPEYQKFNNQHEVAVLIENCDTYLINKELELLQSNPDKLKHLASNCIKARQDWNWENETPKLLELYNSQF